MKHFTVNDRPSLLELAGYLRQINVEEGYDVVIVPHQEKSTPEQRKLFHKLCNLIAEETGHTSKEVKDFLKDEFIDEPLQDGPKSTRDLNCQKYSQLIERTYAFATQELGMLLPHPSDRAWLFLG